MAKRPEAKTPHLKGKSVFPWYELDMEISHISVVRENAQAGITWPFFIR